MSDVNGDASGSILATGISAGAVWFSLQDLVRNVRQLPPGDLHDTWDKATQDMISVFETAQQSAKLSR